MRNPFRKLNNTQLALIWWRFNRLRPKEGKEGYLSPMEREAIADLAIERLAALQVQVDKHRVAVYDEEKAWIEGVKDALDDFKAWIEERECP